MFISLKRSMLALLQSVCKKKEVSYFQAPRLRNIMNFYFSKSLASSSDYMQRIFKYHIFKLLITFSKIFRYSWESLFTVQPNFILSKRVSMCIGGIHVTIWKLFICDQFNSIVGFKIFIKHVQ